MQLSARFFAWVAIPVQYAAQASTAGMAEVGDVLAQLADEEHCGYHNRARVRIHEASLHAGNVFLGEDLLIAAFWRLQLALLRLRQHPEDCATFGEVLHRIGRAQPLSDPFFEALGGLVVSTEAAAEELETDIKNADRDIARHMDTRRLKVNVDTGETDKTVESHNRKEALEGYQVALSLCEPYIGRYVRSWGPLQHAWDEVAMAAKGWNTEGDLCSVGEDFISVDSFLFQMDLQFGARAL